MTEYYARVNQHLNTSEWNYETEALLRILHNEPNHQFILAKDLARVAGFPTGGTQVQMRQIIAKLVDEGHPIISNNSGYAIADFPAQVEKCIDDLINRREGINRRINALSKIKAKMETERGVNKSIFEATEDNTL